MYMAKKGTLDINSARVMMMTKTNDEGVHVTCEKLINFFSLYLICTSCDDYDDDYDDEEEVQ